jgi:protein TonB
MNWVIPCVVLIMSAPACTSRSDVGKSVPARAPAEGDLSEDQTTAPVKVVSDLVQLVKIKDVPPVYPSTARSAQVQGVVIIEAIIDREGRVEKATVLRSVPLLDQAALDAVRQWQFKPQFLNGTAIPVVVILTVPFTLK